jgi:tRNA(Ile)-lysidine synthase
MPAPHPLESKLAAAWSPQDWRDMTVLLAVSGGADSVALLRAMVNLKATTGTLVVAHLNHQLRGQQSLDDETFVVALCHRLGVPCEVARIAAERLADQSSDGLEAAARAVRYEFLRQTAERLGARYVATAHTADDQAETILHRILRGTGISGLSGMRRARLLSPACTLIRPLLGFRRAELVAYLADLGQPYRSDASNEDLRFTRNRIRHELLPQLAEHFNSGVVDSLLRLGILAGEAQEVVVRQAEELCQRHVEHPRPEIIRVGLASLGNQPRYLVREMLLAAWRSAGWPLQAMGFEEWELLAEMAMASRDAASASRPRTFPGNVLARRQDAELLLERQVQPGC